jgi:hypothetical protein
MDGCQKPCPHTLSIFFLKKSGLGFLPILLIGSNPITFQYHRTLLSKFDFVVTLFSKVFPSNFSLPWGLTGFNSEFSDIGSLDGGPYTHTANTLRMTRAMSSNTEIMEYSILQ